MPLDRDNEPQSREFVRRETELHCSQSHLDGLQISNLKSDMTKYDVFGVGNALVDIQARVPRIADHSAESDKGIMTLVDDQQQASVLGELGGTPLNRCAGGSAANTIVALADFGGSAAFVGKVGDDEIGDFFLKDMRDLGVTIDVDPADRTPSGTCAVLITATLNERCSQTWQRRPR